MFVEVHGRKDMFPEHLLDNVDNDNSTFSSDEEHDVTVILSLIRWLSPHRDALLRDSKLRPVCPTPFDINHTLWTFTQEARPRQIAGTPSWTRQLHKFPGKGNEERRQHADKLTRAMFDLVDVRSIENIMNCTSIDNDSELIMETVTLPF